MNEEERINKVNSMEISKNDIHETYRGLSIEITNDGRNYVIYETTQIMKEKVWFASGSTCDNNYFTIAYVHSIANELIKALPE